MIYIWIKKASIFKWKPGPEEFLWRSMISITLKINGPTLEYEIKAQALKDTSWMKPRYLARLFGIKTIKPQLLFTNRRILFHSIVQKEEWHFVVQKVNLLLWLYIT